MLGHIDWHVVINYTLWLALLLLLGYNPHPGVKGL